MPLHRLSRTRFTEPAGPAEVVHAAGGWKARIKRSRLLRGAFETIGRPVLQSLPSRYQVITHHAAGHGYEFEAAEATRCLREGLVESPIMPLDESLANP